MLLRTSARAPCASRPQHRSRRMVVRVVAFKVPDKLQNTEPLKVEPIGNQNDAIMNQAELHLRQYCENMKDPEKQKRCWTVHDFYVDRWTEFQKGCKLEQDEGQAGRKCEQLDRWIQLSRELQAAGGRVQDLYITLSALQRAETKKLEQTGLPLTTEQVEKTTGLSERELQRQKYTALFHKVDRDGNGVMDVAEFFDAMRLMGQFINDRHMEQIGQALDLQGVLTLEQFLDILEIEHSAGKDSALLGALKMKPKWWTSCPKSVDEA